MKSRNSFIPAILMAALLFVSCSKKNELTITETGFGEEIELQQNLMFKFNHDVINDSVIDKWDSTSMLKFTPEVKGLFKWQSKNELIFSPTGSFKPATSYKSEMQPSLLKFFKKGIKLSDKTTSFHTASLKITGHATWWTLSETTSGKLALNASIFFNYNISPSALRQYIKVQVNGQDKEFTTTASESSQELVLKVENIDKPGKEGVKLSININAGASCVECTETLKEFLKWEENVSSPDKLTISEVTPQFGDEDGQIEVQCNQPVDMNDISQFIRITPQLNFTTVETQSGFIIKGAFASNATYALTISKGLKGMIGGSLEDNYTEEVSFGNSEPSLSFSNSKGIYLSSKSSKKVGVYINNIPRVDVRIYKIYENNIIHFMRYNRYNEYWGEDESNYTYSIYDLEQFGNEVMNQEYETRNLPKMNGQYYLSLGFEDKLPFNGIYLVSIRSTEDQWINAAKLISVSDIGIIAKRGNDEMTVFLNSIKDATSMSNVKVTVTSSNNQVLFSGNTDAQGVVQFTGMTSRYNQFAPGLVTVKSDNDFNYLYLNDSRIETSRFETGGLADNSSGFHAYIYGDREIYRPGDSVYFNTLIRKNDVSLQKDIPVKIKLLMPNGREFALLRKTTNSQGAAESRLALPASAVTGTWIIEAYTFNDLLIGSKNISVEEFIPDRINVRIDEGKTLFTIPDSVQLTAAAVNLFGPPAAGRNYQADFTLTRKSFSPKGYEGFNFSLSGLKNNSIPGILREGKTDASGKIKEMFPLDVSLKSTGMISGRIFLTVFDESGRPVNRVQTMDVATQPVFYGIKLSDHYFSVGEVVQAKLAAVLPTGKATRASATVKLIKVDYHTVMERGYDDRFHYRSQREERILNEKSVTIDAQGITLPFNTNESGEYIIRIYNNESERYIESNFYAYSWGSGTASSFAVNTDGQIDITLDKEKYAPGDKAKVLFKTPFAGRLLVTLERNSVINYYYLNTDKRTAELTLPVTEDYLPNVYVTATLFRPLDEGAIPLTAAHGIIPLPVENASNKIPVSISAVEQSKSKTKQTIKIKAASNGSVEVTIAVVDEGIMQLKNSKTPDPYNYFYQKRALSVDGYDVYPFLLPDVNMKRSSSAGDGYDLQKRVNPLTNKRVKLVSLWSGILKTNSAGEASYTINIPQFSGDLRVMAAAWKDKSFGSAEHHIKVADPVVITTSMPRFLSPRDTLYIPVTLANTTQQEMRVNTTLSFTGGLSIIGSNNVNSTIAKGAETQMMFKALASSDVGESSVTATVKSGSEIFTDKTDITIRPPASLQKVNGDGEIKGGDKITIDLSTSFIPQSTETKIVFSRSPVAKFTDQLSYLLDYPHGCVEQTTSIAFPQLYYADLVQSIKNNPSHSVNARDNVNAAIQKLQSMQLYNGALCYWPGGSEESWWGSVYATHFLMEAQKLGYDVNKKTLNKLMSYLQKKVKEHKTETLWYQDATGKSLERPIPAKDIFYSLYILALTGESDLSSMNYYKQRWSELAIDSRYLLAVTYLACGDRKNYDQLLPKQFEGEKSMNAFGGSFYSYVRDEALAMNAILSVDPDNPQLNSMARRLSQSLSQKRYLNTQERSFAFIALGKFLRKSGQSNVSATITDATGKTHSFKGSDLTLKKIPAGKVTIATEGSGSLYYFWEAEGLSKDGSYKQEDSNLKIRRTYLDRYGKEYPSANFKQNDLVVIKLSLENITRYNVENVVITDMLPAGFEIENPRIGAVAELDWIKDNTEPQHMDIRDDRINIYTSVAYKPQNYYYLVRVVSIGNFVTGPAGADAMYHGEYHSYHGAGRISVKER